MSQGAELREAGLEDKPVEVLFPEARRRRRRRRIFAGGMLVAVVAMVIGVAGGVGGWYTAGRPFAGRSPGSAPGGGLPGGRAWAVFGPLLGKYEAPTFVASRAGRAVAWLHGYAGAAQQQTAWLDHRQAGKWVVGKPADALSNSPHGAQSFAFVTSERVVGFDGSHPGLWVSDNAGDSWRLALARWRVDAVNVIGTRVWVAARHCPLMQSCPTVILTGNLNLSDFHALPIQPPQLDRKSARVAAITQLGPTTAVLTTWAAGRRSLLVGDSADRSWTTRPLPCRTISDNPTPIAAADGVLWMTCLLKATGPDQGEGPYATYRSTDAGIHWRDMTGGSDLPLNLAAYPVSSTIAWGWQGDPYSQLVRTTDGGHRWNNVTTPWKSSTGAAYTELAALTPAEASVLVQSLTDGGWRFTVYTTTDSGRSWRARRLPVPPNLPRGQGRSDLKASR